MEDTSYQDYYYAYLLYFLNMTHTVSWWSYRLTNTMGDRGQFPSERLYDHSHDVPWCFDHTILQYMCASFHACYSCLEANDRPRGAGVTGVSWAAQHTSFGGNESQSPDTQSGTLLRVRRFSEHGDRWVCEIRSYQTPGSIWGLMSRVLRHWSTSRLQQICLEVSSWYPRDTETQTDW